MTPEVTELDDAQKSHPLLRELQVARRLALASGCMLLREKGRAQVRVKAHGEVVTSADIESDRLIRAGLADAFPGDAIFSEETQDSPQRLTHSRVWIVDPLDGTSNFVEKGDEFSISIGLVVDHVPILGVVYNPSRHQLFTGCAGLGITLNHVEANLRQVSSLASASILISRKEWRRGLSALQGGFRLTPVASMAYKLARVAAGLDDAVFSAAARKEWGTCAGVALVLAGGGRATLMDGSPIRFNRREARQPMGMVAAGSDLHPILLNELAQVPQEIWERAAGHKSRAALQHYGSGRQASLP